MSPSVGNFVHDLVEMAKAMETLPQVQADLQQANRMNFEQGEVIAAREESILKLKAEIEALNNRVRDAEVARDDAELRFLELDEKAGKVLSSLGNIQANLNDAVNGLTPPKPEPQPEPEPINPHAQEPVLEHAAGEIVRELPYAYEAPQGQSESNPTAIAASDLSPNVSSDPVSEPVLALAKPYSGKFYYDHPVYVTLHDWLEGGGTEENYYRSKPRDYSGEQDPNYVTS